MEKLPPIEKIYEAYSAIADNRIIINTESANITSSNREKEYIVAWKENIYASNDSASYWQGYSGYPVIAVLMLQGKLSLNRNIANLFKGINWTALNKKHKRNYSEAVNEVISNINEDKQMIENEVNSVYEEIKKLDIIIKRTLSQNSKSKK